jgi:hypothetical protein
MRQLSHVAWAVTLLLIPTGHAAYCQEPPAVNPFGPREQNRADAGPGYVELSDGSVHPGQIYLTRDARLKILDAEQQRTRDVPLSAVRRIDCQVKREWMEKEWRFKENANDEKVYTGRLYPSREYTHKITLQEGRTIQGPMSAIVYVQAEGSSDRVAQRFLLHERDKGPPGRELKSLSFVRVIELGDKALEEGKKRARAGEESKKERTGKNPPQ